MAKRLTGNRCQCPTCAEYFNGVQPFDKHRVGDFGKDRRCLTVAEMKARGWTRNAAGFWRERAKEPTLRPRAHGFAAHRAAPARVRPRPGLRAHKTRLRGEGAT
jgi:hypothetical protein